MVNCTVTAEQLEEAINDAMTQIASSIPECFSEEQIRDNLCYLLSSGVLTIDPNLGLIAVDPTGVSINGHGGLVGTLDINALSAVYEAILPATPDNPETQYLNGNREWAPIAIGAGGFAGNLYFTTKSSTDIPTYYQISYEFDSLMTELTALVTNEDQLINSYVFESPLSATAIDAGAWISNYHANVSNPNGLSRIRIDVFLRHIDNSETTLFTAYTPELNNTSYSTIRTEYINPTYNCDPTDRLGVKLFASTTGTNVTFSIEIGDGNASYITTPLRVRHSQLRALNEDPLYQHVTEDQINAWTSTEATVSSLSASWSNVYTGPKQIQVSFDGQGFTPVSGSQHLIRIPEACEITGWMMFSDLTGNVSVDVWKSNFAEYPPSASESIAGTEKPHLNGTIENLDASLTTWATQLAEGDLLIFNVDSASGDLTKFTVILNTDEVTS